MPNSNRSSRQGSESTAVVPFDAKTAMTTISASLEEQTAMLSGVLNDLIPVDRFKAVVARAIAKDEKLVRCTPLSLMRAIVDAAALGLEPTGKYGGAYLVPFWNSDKSCYEATLIIGYDGLKELAYRSKVVTLVDGDSVRANDEFSYRKGWPDAYLSHSYPAGAGARGELIGAWAAVHLVGAPQPLIVFMPKDAIDKRRRVSKSGSNKDTGEAIGIWRQWDDEMYLKTALRAVLDLSPKSVIEIVGRAFQIEDAHDSLLTAAGTAPVALPPGAPGRRRRLQSGAGLEVEPETEAGGESALETTETAGSGEVTSESGTDPAAAGEASAAPETTESPAPESNVCGDPSPYDQAPCQDPPGHPAKIHRDIDTETGEVRATWPVK